MVRTARFRVYLAGSLLAATVAWSLLASGSAMAQTLPPRPTVVPQPTATPVPTHHDGDDDATPAEPGRIAGTVIDLRTGAPAPGMKVLVGPLTLTTDANGNYDRSDLAAGSYTIALADGQGTPAQAPINVQLAAGASIIQHLGFTSPVPAVAPTTPATLPQTGGTDNNWAWMFGLFAIVLGAGLTRAVVRGRR